MEIEKLIKHMREEAQDYRSGRTLGRAFADAEDVLDEAATALERLQAENDRLKRERDAAVESWRGFCSQCAWKNHQYLADGKMDDRCRTCRDNAKCNWKWRGPKEE